MLEFIELIGFGVVIIILIIIIIREALKELKVTQKEIIEIKEMEELK